MDHYIDLLADCETEGEVITDGCRTCGCHEGFWICHSYTCSGTYQFKLVKNEGEGGT